MKVCRMAIGAVCLVSNLLLLSVLAVHSPLCAEDVIDVKRDKEKTVYTIGGSDRIRQEEAAERDKALEMIKSMSPIIDKRQHPRASTPTQ